MANWSMRGSRRGGESLAEVGWFFLRRTYMLLHVVYRVKKKAGKIPPPPPRLPPVLEYEMQTTGAIVPLLVSSSSSSSSSSSVRVWYQRRGKGVDRRGEEQQQPRVKHLISQITLAG